MELVDVAIKIPMIGAGASLNVAVAGSLVLCRLAGFCEGEPTKYGDNALTFRATACAVQLAGDPQVRPAAIVEAGGVDVDEGVSVAFGSYDGFHQRAGLPIVRVPRVRFGDAAADHRVALIAEQLAVVNEVELEPVLVAQQQVNEVMGQLQRVWQGGLAGPEVAPNRPYPAPPTEPEESSTDSYDSRNQRIASRATLAPGRADPISWQGMRRRG
jgi:hypothetical protein